MSNCKYSVLRHSRELNYSIKLNHSILKLGWHVGELNHASYSVVGYFREIKYKAKLKIKSGWHVGELNHALYSVVGYFGEIKYKAKLKIKSGWYIGAPNRGILRSGISELSGVMQVQLSYRFQVKKRLCL